MTQPRMMLNGQDPAARKKQLAARVEGTMADLCDCCLQAAAMGTEEFFNKCHDEGGRFCGGPGGKGGPGTRRPAPLDYIKKRVDNAIGVHQGKERSQAVNRVTTGAVRAVLGRITIPTSTAYGSVKIHRLSRTNLNSFTDKDLDTVKTALKTDQRRYNLMNSVGWSGVALTTAGGAAAGGKYGSVGGPAGAAIGAVYGAALFGSAIGLARWKSKRIPGQISRIDRELKARESGGGSLSSGQMIELASNESFPTLAQEIAQAKKDIESGNGPKNPKRLSADELSELGKVIAGLEVDAEEGITAGMIKELKKVLAAVSAGNK